MNIGTRDRDLHNLCIIPDRVNISKLRYFRIFQCHIRRHIFWLSNHNIRPRPRHKKDSHLRRFHMSHIRHKQDTTGWLYFHRIQDYNQSRKWCLRGNTGIQFYRLNIGKLQVPCMQNNIDYRGNIFYLNHWDRNLRHMD